MSEYPAHIPPHHAYPAHIPPQHSQPRIKQRKRKQKPPASLSKLHRPLTRFYCNDCKKKFRSRILANRNNNAVQHYCSLYSKIITRKVDSHSNKCKGDHGMGPCVVRRTDSDPDSDGEDETKAAYYADKGKKRPSTKRSGAYTKKRKRSTVSETEQPSKKQRISESGVTTQYYPPVPQGYNGYYNENGYVNGYGQVSSPVPPMPPPVMEHNGHNGYVSEECMLPPPPLEEFESEIVSANENTNNGIGIRNEDNISVNGNGNESERSKEIMNGSDMDLSLNLNLSVSVTINGHSNEESKETGGVCDVGIVEEDSCSQDSAECINDEATEEEEEQELVVPIDSMPIINNQNDEELDELVLEVPM